MAERILDVRTDQPVNYSDLEDEAAELASGDEGKLPSAEREVAAKANPEKEANIVRRLRERRKKRARTALPMALSQPAPGYGVLMRDLGTHAKALENELTQALKNQVLSRPRVEQIQAQAHRLHEIAEKRLQYLDSLEAEHAAELLRPVLDGLDEVERAMEASVFVSAEWRQVDLILKISSRLLDKSDSCLQFLR